MYHKAKAAERQGNASSKSMKAVATLLQSSAHLNAHVNFLNFRARAIEIGIIHQASTVHGGLKENPRPKSIDRAQLACFSRSSQHITNLSLYGAQQPQAEDAAQPASALFDGR
jgi:hypothetical protein